MTDLADLQSVTTYAIPSATLLFMKPSHLNALTSAILNEAKLSSAVLYSIAWRHKLASISEGFVSKQSLWDRLVFDAARVSVMDKGAGTVRGVIVSGGERFSKTFVYA